MNHSSQNGSIKSGCQSYSVIPTQGPQYKPDKETEFFLIAARNWLIHQRYVRKEFDICKLLIEEELQKTNSYNEYANYILGLILRHEGKILDSLEYFKKCHLLNPKNIENTKQVAKSLQHPGSCELAVELGLLCLKRQDHACALLWLGYALAHDPKSTDALIAMGAMLQDHGEADNALAKYKMAAQHLPESAALWNNVGMCLFSKKKYIAAISCLRRASYLSPLDWLVQHNLGLVLLSCAQYASAFVSLSTCIKLNPRHAPSFMLLAQTLMHLDDPGNAGKAYEQAVKLDGEDPAIRANFAAYFVRLGQHHQGLEQLNAFNKLAQQVSNIDPQVLMFVRSLTAEVTKDVVPQRYDSDALEQQPQYQITPNRIMQDSEETERVLASDEV